MRLKALLVTIALALSTFGSVAHAGWEQDKTLTAVQFDGKNNRVLLYVAGGTSNPASCAGNSYVEIPSTANPFELGRLALAAYLAGKKVTLHISDTECGSKGQPVTTFISVKD